MYADDTTLFCNMDNNVDEHVINNELCKISEWLGANKLSLNISKTKFMVFHTSNRSVTYPVLQIDRRPIERVAQFNFLCLILQSNLAWNNHINHVSLKISKTIGILYRLMAIYPSAILQTLYNTLILPFLIIVFLCGEQQLVMVICFIVYKQSSEIDFKLKLHCTH